jgi:hypothetical protein
MKLNWKHFAGIVAVLIAAYVGYTYWYVPNYGSTAATS